MLTFDELKAQIDLQKSITKRLDLIGIYDSDFANEILMLFDNFISSHFTLEGCDLVYWWLYESVPKVIYETIKPDIFTKESKKIEINVKELDALWKYMERNKKLYFK